MTLQGSLLSNGNGAAMPLAMEPNTMKDPGGVYMNESSNGSGGGETNGLHSENNPEEVKEQAAEEPCIDITINNVVCSFSVKSHLNLKHIAQQGFNVEYRRENGVSETYKSM